MGALIFSFALGFLWAGMIKPDPEPASELTILEEEVQIRMLEVMDAELEFYGLIQEIAEECKAVGLSVSQCFSSLSSEALPSTSTLREASRER